jgi:hypothetical protein
MVEQSKDIANSGIENRDFAIDSDTDCEGTTCLNSPTGRLHLQGVAYEDGSFDAGNTAHDGDARRLSYTHPSQSPTDEFSAAKEAPVTWMSLPNKRQLAILTIARLSEPLVQTSLQV